MRSQTMLLRAVRQNGMKGACRGQGQFIFTVECSGVFSAQMSCPLEQLPWNGALGANLLPGFLS